MHSSHSCNFDLEESPLLKGKLLRGRSSTLNGSSVSDTLASIPWVGQSGPSALGVSTPCCNTTFCRGNPAARPIKRSESIL